MRFMKNLKNNIEVLGKRTVQIQETIEEKAKIYSESNQYDLEFHDEGGYQGIDPKIFAEKLVDFTNKWQQERNYSKEDMILFSAWIIKRNIEELNDPTTLTSIRTSSNEDLLEEYFKQSKK